MGDPRIIYWILAEQPKPVSVTLQIQADGTGSVLSMLGGDGDCRQQIAPVLMRLPPWPAVDGEPAHELGIAVDMRAFALSCIAVARKHVQTVLTALTSRDP